MAANTDRSGRGVVPVLPAQTGGGRDRRNRPGEMALVVRPMTSTRNAEIPANVGESRVFGQSRQLGDVDQWRSHRRAAGTGRSACPVRPLPPRGVPRHATPMPVPMPESKRPRSSEGGCMTTQFRRWLQSGGHRCGGPASRQWFGDQLTAESASDEIQRRPSHDRRTIRPASTPSSRNTTVPQPFGLISTGMSPIAPREMK